MTDVLYLKWTVPHRLGESQAKNLLFTWAVLQVKPPIMAHVHPQSLEQGRAWNGNSEYPLSSLVSRTIQAKHTLLVGFAQFSGQEGPSLTQGSTWSQYLQVLQCLQSPTLIARLLYFFKMQNWSLQKRKTMFYLFCFISFCSADNTTPTYQMNCKASLHFNCFIMVTPIQLWDVKAS